MPLFFMFRWSLLYGLTQLVTDTLAAVAVVVVVLIVVFWRHRRHCRIYLISQCCELDWLWREFPKSQMYYNIHTLESQLLSAH